MGTSAESTLPCGLWSVRRDCSFWRCDEIDWQLVLADEPDEHPLVREVPVVGQSEGTQHNPPCFTDAKRELEQIDQLLRRQWFFGLWVEMRMEERQPREQTV